MSNVKTIVTCFSLAVMPALAAAHTQSTPPPPRPVTAPPAGTMQTPKTTKPDQTKPDQKMGERAKMAAQPMDDKDFIMKVAQGGNTEVALGELAETNAERAGVKAAGKKIAADHMKANAELKSIAQSKHIEISDTDLGEGVSIKDRLTAMKGKDFDALWIDHMVEDHEKDIAMFQAQTHTADPQVKAFATKTLPTLKQHLAMVKKLKK